MPFIHIIAISLSSTRPIMSGLVTFFPKEFNIDAYTKVFSDMAMIRSLGFTIMLTVLATVLSMIMTIAVAYSLSKKSCADESGSC